MRTRFGEFPGRVAAVGRRCAAGAVVTAVVAAGGAVPASAAAGPVKVARVMALGDSITAGSGDATRSGYRIRLQKQLRAGGARIDMVGGQTDGWCCDRDHEGHGGWTTARLRAGLGPWLARHRPDVVLLHIGTNDVTSRRPTVDIVRDLERIIRLIRMRRPHALVFVGLLVRTTDRQGQARTRALNAKIPSAVRRAGARTYLVVGTAAVGARPGELADVRHPNERGYAVMADVWYQAVRQRARGAAWWPAGKGGRG